jgi:hypothetical protein
VTILLPREASARLTSERTAPRSEAIQ